MSPDRTGRAAEPDPRTWPPIRLLVGFDGSEGSRDALALARALAGAGASLLLVNVIPPAVPMPMRPRLLAGEEPPQSRDFFAPARAAVEDHEVETRSYSGRSAAQVLTDIAEREKTDVVVVGSTSRSVLGRALLGSTGRGVMYGAAAPAVVAPLGYVNQDYSAPPQPIAVAYDGTPEAKAALEYAEAAARAGNSELRVLTVATRATTPAGMLGYEPPMPKSPSESPGRRSRRSRDWRRGRRSKPGRWLDRGSDRRGLRRRGRLNRGRLPWLWRLLAGDDRLGGRRPHPPSGVPSPRCAASGPQRA